MPTLLASDGPAFAQLSKSLGDDLALLAQQCLRASPSQRISVGDALLQIKRLLMKMRLEVRVKEDRAEGEYREEEDGGDDLDPRSPQQKKRRGKAQQPRASYWHVYPRVKCLEENEGRGGGGGGGGGGREGGKTDCDEVPGNSEFSVLRGRIFRARGGNFLFSSPRDAALFLLPNFVPCALYGQDRTTASAELSVSVAEEHWERRVLGWCERRNVDHLGLVCYPGNDVVEDEGRGEAGRLENGRARDALWKGGTEEGELIYESVASQLRYRGLDRDLKLQLDKDLVRCHPYHCIVSSPDFRSRMRRVLEVWLHFGQRDGRAYWQGVDSIVAPFLLEATHRCRAQMGIGTPGHGTARRDNAVDARAFLALESYVVENAPGFFVSDNSEAMQEVRCIGVRFPLAHARGRTWWKGEGVILPGLRCGALISPLRSSYLLYRALSSPLLDSPLVTR